jgi:hypothetical protein
MKTSKSRPGPAVTPHFPLLESASRSDVHHFDTCAWLPPTLSSACWKSCHPFPLRILRFPRRMVPLRKTQFGLRSPRRRPALDHRRPCFPPSRAGPPTLPTRLARTRIFETFYARARNAGASSYVRETLSSRARRVSRCAASISRPSRRLRSSVARTRSHETRTSHAAPSCF